MEAQEGSEEEGLRVETFKAKDYLKEMRLRLRDGMSEISQNAFTSVVDAFEKIGAISEADADLWIAAMKVCPGHDDEGGRMWCAYCGDLKKSFTDRTEEGE